MDLTDYIYLIRQHLLNDFRGMYRPAGEPILNPGFQNWNYLVLNMIAWLEDKPVAAEF